MATTKKRKWKPAPDQPEKKRVSREIEWTPLDPKKHGVGGVVRGPLRYRKQDRRASGDSGYAVVFFPRIKGIGRAHIHLYVRETLSYSPEAAVSKFMDQIARSETWAAYYKAGHRVRQIRLTDLGDAPLKRKRP